ncbi:hypothetical protein [Nocardiopsis oceani]
MRNPIPSPRPSSDPLYRTLPRRRPLEGPACPACTHPSCRERRAERLPRLGGHRSEYASEHTQAARIQARYRHLVIWWGEATQSFWIATPAGLEEAHDMDALLLKLWSHTDPPAARPWVRV